MMAIGITESVLLMDVSLGERFHSYLHISSSFLHYIDAVKQITNFMGMQPCERSDKVDPDKSSHSLLLAGVYRGGHDVLVKARLARSATHGVNMKIIVRSPDINACEMIAAAVG